MSEFLQDPGIQQILREFMELPDRIMQAVQMGLMSGGGMGGGGGGGSNLDGGGGGRRGSGGGLDIDKDISGERWAELDVEQKRVDAYRQQAWWDPFSATFMQEQLNDRKTALAYEEALNPGSKPGPPPVPKPVLPDMTGAGLLRMPDSPIDEDDPGVYGQMKAMQREAEAAGRPDPYREILPKNTYDWLPGADRTPFAIPVHDPPDQGKIDALTRGDWNDSLKPLVPPPNDGKGPPVHDGRDRTAEVSRRFWNGGDDPGPPSPPTAAVAAPSNLEGGTKGGGGSLDELMDLFRPLFAKGRGLLAAHGARQEQAASAAAGSDEARGLAASQKQFEAQASDFADVLIKVTDAARKFKDGLDDAGGGNSFPELKNRAKGETEN